ncbi:hypothetical protein [Brachyspira pilosicoli]|uniref:hypothetical protein n=1 Tax=Brachyspira pilosicoli TaxID=52584 RepID=UPI00242B54CC
MAFTFISRTENDMIHIFDYEVIDTPLNVNPDDYSSMCNTVMYRYIHYNYNDDGTIINQNNDKRYYECFNTFEEAERYINDYHLNGRICQDCLRELRNNN